MLRTKYSEEIEKQMKAYFDTLRERRKSLFDSTNRINLVLIR